MRVFVGASEANVLQMISRYEEWCGLLLVILIWIIIVIFQFLFKFLLKVFTNVDHYHLLYWNQLRLCTQGFSLIFKQFDQALDVLSHDFLAYPDWIQ